jgi:hypothetical protein
MLSADGETDRHCEAIWLIFAIFVVNMPKEAKHVIQKYRSLHYNYVSYYKTTETNFQSHVSNSEFPNISDFQQLISRDIIEISKQNEISFSY